VRRLRDRHLEQAEEISKLRLENIRIRRVMERQMGIISKLQRRVVEVDAWGPEGSKEHPIEL